MTDIFCEDLERFPFLNSINLEFKLGNQQVEAIDNMINWFKAYKADPIKVRNRFILTGFAGTGKTSVVKPFMDAIGINIESAAYGALSGKASQVLNSKGLPAYTIHSQIYEFTDNPNEAKLGIEAHIERLIKIKERFEGDKEYTKLINKSIKIKKEELIKIEKKEYTKYSKWFILNIESEFHNKQLIVIDEASMIDKIMEIDILSFGIPTIFIGDPLQLDLAVLKLL